MGADTSVAMQRAGVLVELPSLLREHGVDPVPIFAGSGADASTLAADARLPFAAVPALLERAAAATGCAHFGVLLGLRFTLDHHGAIGRLMRTAPTVETALTDFVTWQPGYSSGAVVYLLGLDEGKAFGYGAYDPSAPGNRQLYLAVAAVGVRMIAELTGGAARASEVHFSVGAPDDAGRSCARLLGTPVRFGETRTCALLDRRTLKAPVAPGAAAERRRIAGEIGAMLASAKMGASVRTGHVLRPLLQAGRPSMAAAARVLGVHPRTLRRRLADEGTSFGQLRDAVRFAIAREFLEMTEISIGEIADALAFASAGTFAEAFRRWTGTSASRWRDAGRAGAG